MDGMMYRMRMAFTAFAALVVLGVLFFVDDEAAPDLAANDPAELTQSPRVESEPVNAPIESVSDAVANEFTPDDELIDDAMGLSTDGFDTHGIDTDGFDPQGIDTGGSEVEADIVPDPVIDTPDEGVIVDGDGSGS